MPCDAAGNALKNWQHPDAWLTWEQAAARPYGIGLVLDRRSRLFCIDLDGSRDPATGQWSQIALELFANFPNAYREISMSGRGAHIIGLGSDAIPAGHMVKRTGQPIEVYTENRSIWLTGTEAQGSAVVEYGPVLHGLMTHYNIPLVRPVIKWDEGRDPAWSGPEDDDELIAHGLAKMTSDQAFGGTLAFRELWHMDVAALARKKGASGREDGLPFDHNAIDASMMNHLAYLTGRDAPRMVRLFERWAGYRPEKYEGKAAYRLTRVVGVGMACKGVLRVDMRGPGEMALTASITPPPPGGKRVACADLLSLQNGAMIAATEFAPLQYLAEEFLPMGCWLLIGPPKRGKTWLMLDLAVAVAGGGEFLGNQCEQGRVLYLALEENKRRIKTRCAVLCKEKGLDPQIALGQILFGAIDDEIPTADGGLYQMIADALDRDPLIKLVIVDTLHKARPAPKHGEGVYAYDRRCVDPFTDMLATRPGRSIMVVHHTKKSKSTDPFEMASGSMGLTGAADGHIFLLPDEQGQMVMHLQGRDAEPIEWAMKLNNAVWEVLGDPDNASMSDTRAKIINAMQKYATPVKAKDIAADTGIEANTITQRLRGMCKDGYVMKQGYGQYVLTPKSTALGMAPPPYVPPS